MASSRMRCGKAGRLGSELVLKGETERRVTLLNLLHALLDHDKIAAVADELCAQLEEHFRVLRAATDRTPPFASALGRRSHGPIGVGHHGMIELIRNPGNHAQVART